MEFCEGFLPNAAIFLLSGILWRRRWLPISRSRFLRIEHLSHLFFKNHYYDLFISVHLPLPLQGGSACCLRFLPHFLFFQSLFRSVPHLTFSLTCKWPNAVKGWNNLSGFSLRFLLQDLGLFKYWIKMITLPECYSSVGWRTADNYHFSWSDEGYGTCLCNNHIK